MQTSTRGRLGAALVAASVIAVVILHLRGVVLFSLSFHDDSNSPTTTGFSANVHIHWLTVVLLLTVAVGLGLCTRKKKTETTDP